MQIAQKVNKKIIIRDAGDIHFAASYDVIVVGLGSAGAIAAITAAKQDLKVLGIDRLNCMGGMATAGAVMHYYFGGTGGYYEEIEKIKSQYCTSVYVNNADAKKYVLEQEAVKNGVKLSYNSIVTAVFMERKTVKGIRLLDINGITMIGCKVLIDCTGDADICEMMGCKTFWGRELDGRTQPYTSVKVFLSDNKFTRTNSDSGFVDQSDAWELSKAIIVSHASHFEKKYGSTRQRLLYLAPLIGIREGRHIEGEEVLRLNRFLQDEKTTEPIFYAYSDIDKHGWDNAFESETMQDWFVACNLGAMNVSIPIPLAVMIPKGYKGILTAGRCMSMDHDIFCGVRMVRDMQKAGEAAGVAAGLSIKRGYPLKEIPYSEILSILKETGCYNPDNNIGLRFDSPRNDVLIQTVNWFTEAEDIKHGLSGDKPGIALWSVKRIGEKMKNHLVRWMKTTDNDCLKKHSAIALALIGEKESLSVIRDMIRRRDSFILKDCRKNNQMRGYIAIYLAGKLKDVEIVDELIDIICNPKEFDRPLYHDNDLVSNVYRLEVYNNLYFQFFSYSIMALVKIGNAHDELRDKIGSALRKALEKDDYIKRITQHEENSCEYSISKNIKNIVEKEFYRQ